MLGGFQLYRGLWHTHYSGCEDRWKRCTLLEAATGINLNFWWASETAFWSFRWPVFPNRKKLQKRHSHEQKGIFFCIYGHTLVFDTSYHSCSKTKMFTYLCITWLTSNYASILLYVSIHILFLFALFPINHVE